MVVEEIFETHGRDKSILQMPSHHLLVIWCCRKPETTDRAPER